MEKEGNINFKKNARRTVLTGLGALSLFSLLKALRFPGVQKQGPIACSPESKEQTKKLLTQDGRLVEVDVSRIKLLQEKISDKELQEWIRRP